MARTTRSFKKTGLGLALLTAFSLPAQASEWLQVRNEGLLSGAVSLPVLAPTRPETGKVHFGARFELTNDFVARASDNESILLDGETYRLSLSASGRFTENSHWVVRMPFLGQGGGFMDDFINDWHDFFNLPDGGRESARNGQYRFRVTRDGETLLDVDDEGTRLGDLEIAWHFDLLENLLLGAQLKLPTGRHKKLAGGGTTGGSIWLTQEWDWWRLSGFVSVGGSANGRGKILRSEQRRLTPFGGAGLSIRLNRWARLVSQVYAHRSVFGDSELKPLDDPGTQLSIGMIFRLREHMRLHLLFQEDVVTQSSPDFSMQAALYW